MFKLISIDPGKCKCGLVLVDLQKKKVDQAIVLNTEFLPNYVKNLKSTMQKMNLPLQMKQQNLSLKRIIYLW